MLIGICDDEELIVEQLYKNIISLLGTNASEHTFKKYTSGIEVIHDASKLNALFLDIDMPDTNGMDIANIINESATECIVIFVTARDDLVKDGYKVGVSRFITKPVELDELKEALDFILESPPGNTLMTVYKNYSPYTIMQKNIEYLESDNGHTIIYYNAESYRRDESLSSLERTLDKRLFQRINQSRIINLSYIADYNPPKVKTLDGYVHRISRTYLSDFKQSFIEYDLKYRK